MRFDFETMLDRAGRDAMAVELIGMPGGFAPTAPKEGFDAIPMWVADMSFATAPSVIRAIEARAAHPAFGYYMPSQAYFDAIIGWHVARNGTRGLAAEHIGYENGVLGGVATALRAFTEPGDAVLLNSPYYVGFSGCVKRAGRRLEASPLVRDADGAWRMDFDDMDRRIVENDIKLAIFCTPHNPCGRVWERWELERAAEVFARRGVVVVSDEIWSDLVLGGRKHVPFQSVSDDARSRTVALYAPTKTFNLAGLVGSYHVAYDEGLRERMRAAADATCYNSMNVLSMHALIGAYSEEGATWVDELCGVLRRNVGELCDFVDAVPGLEAARPEGTYMVFIDCAGWLAAHETTMDALLKALWDVGVAVQDGRQFAGPTHIRANTALPTSKLREAIGRMGEYVFGE